VGGKGWERKERIFLWNIAVSEKKAEKAEDESPSSKYTLKCW